MDTFPSARAQLRHHLSLGGTSADSSKLAFLWVSFPPPVLSPAPPHITSLPPGTYLFCICLTLCTVSGVKSPKRPLIFLAESQGLEWHQAQSKCSRSSSYDYALQTPAPSGGFPGPDGARQPSGRNSTSAYRKLWCREWESETAR